MLFMGDNHHYAERYISFTIRMYIYVRMQIFTLLICSHCCIKKLLLSETLCALQAYDNDYLLIGEGNEEPTILDFRVNWDNGCDNGARDYFLAKSRTCNP